MSFVFPNRTAPADLIKELGCVAAKLVMREARGPGDYANAMRRIEARYGIPYWTLWALRYKLPKSADFATAMRICFAFEHQSGCVAESDAPGLTEAKTILGRAMLRSGAALRGGGAALGRGGDAVDRFIDRMDGADDWPVIPG